MTSRRGVVFAWILGLSCSVLLFLWVETLLTPRSFMLVLILCGAAVAFVELFMRRREKRNLLVAL
jgi:hypothetical protein